MSKEKVSLFEQARDFGKNFWTALPQSGHKFTIPSFQLRSLAKVSKAGFAGSLVCCTLLYGWDQYAQHQSRITFNSTRPKGKVGLEISHALQSEDLDTWEYSQSNNLVQRYGAGTMVKVGGGRKEGFRGLIPLPSILAPSEEVRSGPLETSSVCHVGLVVQPVKSDEESRPLIIGRQSPLGPLPTLRASIHAGWQQFINPVKGKTISSVMTESLSTTIENESPHIVKGTSFDTMVIQDLAVPVEFVEDAIQQANTDLNPVMTFAWDNCMTTKTYALLKLAERVDRWANSGVDGAPNREQADAFITGCYDIIAVDIHARGYGVLNNEKVTQTLIDFGSTAKSIGRQVEHDRVVEDQRLRFE